MKDKEDLGDICSENIGMDVEAPITLLAVRMIRPLNLPLRYVA